MSLGPSHDGEFLVPWRQVSSQAPSLIYYAVPSPRGCLPPLWPSRSLVRHELATPSPAPAPAPARVLVLVNPTSGRASPALTRRRVSALTAILREAALRPELAYTARAGHAAELVAARGADGLAAFAAVVSVGGDGTLSEVVCGLCAACPKGAAAAPPLAVVPAGSGNAAAASLGLPSVEHAALNVVHALRRGGGGRPMAVLRYKAGGRERVAVGGVQWGFTADVDQGTEGIRFLGGLRFELGAVWGILRKRVVRGRMRIAVDEGKQETAVTEINGKRKAAGKGPLKGMGECVGGEYVLEGGFVMVVAWNSHFIGEGFQLLPEASLTETGVFDVVVVREGMGRADMVRLLLSAEDGSFLYKVDGVQYYKATRLEFEHLDGDYLTVDGDSVPVEPFVLDMADQDGRLTILDSFSDDAVAAGTP